MARAESVLRETVTLTKYSRDINARDRKIKQMEKEMRGLKATISQLQESSSLRRNQLLQQRIQELETLHYLDQSLIVRYRRMIGIMDGE